MDNEATDSIFRNNRGGVFCKLNIVKAYDSVHGLNLYMWGVGKVAFGEKLIRWIKQFISTTSFSVLLNGTQIGYFRISKGGPLSPYLFVMSFK